jgi:hypothetical protein
MAPSVPASATGRRTSVTLQNQPSAPGRALAHTESLNDFRQPAASATGAAALRHLETRSATDGRYRDKKGSH